MNDTRTSTSRRSLSRAAFAVVAAVAGGAALVGCGVLNGLWWPAEVTDADFCTSVAGLVEKQNECRGADDAVDGSADCDAACFRQFRDRCSKEYEALLTCAFAPHECGELPSSDAGFCNDEVQAMADCAGVPPNDPCNTGGPQLCTTCDGGGCDGRCVAGESPACGDCQGGNCNSDGLCRGNETAESCAPDCHACTNDTVCDDNESRIDCNECLGSSACSLCNGSNCDDTCVNGENPNCPDCAGPCHVDGHCEGDETQGNCPADCHACETDGFCDINESHVECSDCNGGNPCNNNTTCEPGRGENEQNCPSDCRLTCGNDADCAGQICDKLQQQFCGQGDPNCTSTSAEPQCRDGCNSSAECGPEVCVVSPANQNRGVCEQTTCGADPDCSAAQRCAKPFEMNPGTGLCLTRCDPEACAGGGCQCTQPFFNRCATIRSGGSIVDFACTAPGPGVPFDPCDVEGDCGAGLTCVNGACKSFCFFIGSPCNGGFSCQELGSSGVGFCPG